MKTKFNLDRKPLDSSFIQSRQDFDKVLKGYQAMKPPLWKNPWFYGPVGLASLALVLTITFQNNFFAGENNSTLNKTSENNTNQALEDTPCVKPLSANSDIPFEIFTVDPNKDAQLVTENGSILNIPKNCLLAGENGEVSIKVREFSNPAEAFIAGIPMDYEKSYAFESGGMIEIRGEQNGKQITINPNKPIEVDMSLYKSGEDFKFWSMNDKTGEWKEYPCEISTNSGKPNVAPSSKSTAPIHKIRSEIENCEKEIEQLKKEDKKEELIPTKDARKLVVSFDPGSFPELAGYKEIEFEYLLPENQSAENMAAFKKRIEYASSQTWYDMDVSKGKSDYIVTFKNNRENYSIPVKPVLKGSSLAKLDQELKQAKATKEVQLAKLEEEKLELQKQELTLKAKYEKDVNAIKNQLNSYVPTGESSTLAQRSASSTTAQTMNGLPTNNSNVRGSFITGNFGVFNCDRPISYPKPFEEPILCQTTEGIDIRIAGAYVIDQKDNTRFTFGEFNFRPMQELAWNKRNKSTLFVIDKEGNLYYKQNVQDHTAMQSPLFLKRIDREDVNLGIIQKILSENSLTA